MKKTIITIIAAFGLTAGLLNAADTFVINDEVVAAKFAERKALVANAAVKSWVSQNMDFFSAAAKEISSLKAENAYFVARYYLEGSNAGKKQWTVGADIAKTYHVRIYLSRFASAEELSATAPTRQNYDSIVSGAKRHGMSSLVNATYTAMQGRGIMTRSYQKWFLKKISTVSDSQAATMLAAEIKALYAIAPSEEKTAWLNELTTIKQAETLLK